MRVLQLGRYFHPRKGGIERAIKEIHENLLLKGVDSHVLTTSEPTTPRGFDPADPTVFRSSRLFTLLSTPISLSLVNQFRRYKFQFDIVHLHLPDPLVTLALFLSGYKGKVVLHWHSDIVRQKISKILFNPLQKWALRRADQIIVATEVYANSSVDLQPYLEKVSIVPFGLDCRHLVPQEKTLQEIDAKFAGKKIVFSMGRLVYYKNYNILIEAAKFLPDHYVVVIAGGGPLFDELKQQIETLNLQQKVFLLGKISDGDAAAWYRSASCFCLTSQVRSEAFGLVLLEAMSFGKPIVAVNIPGSGVPWVNAHGITGINASPNNARDVADSIIQIHNDANKYKSYCAASQQRYQEQFKPEKMATMILELYARLGTQK